MRRLLALFVLCVFSLQACWAAAAPYCQHENAPRAAHVGHHVHDHDGDLDSEDQAGALPDTGLDAPGALTPDLDCHACHACVACVMPGGVGLAATPAAAPTPHRVTAALPAPPPARLDRPDWQSLA